MDDRKQTGRKYSQEDLVNPLHRRGRSGADLCRAIHGYVQRTLTNDGVFPQYIAWRRDGTRGDHQEITVKVPGGVVIEKAMELLYGGHGISQLIFGVDSTEPRHLPNGAGVVIGFWSHGTWKIGVIHYRTKPRFISPIDWNHQPSINWMHQMILLFHRKHTLGRRPGETNLGRGLDAPIKFKRED